MFISYLRPCRFEMEVLYENDDVDKWGPKSVLIHVNSFPFEVTEVS